MKQTQVSTSYATLQTTPYKFWHVRSWGLNWEISQHPSQQDIFTASSIYSTVPFSELPTRSHRYFLFPPSNSFVQSNIQKHPKTPGKWVNSFSNQEGLHKIVRRNGSCLLPILYSPPTWLHQKTIRLHGWQGWVFKGLYMVQQTWHPKPNQHNQNLWV